MLKKLSIAASIALLAGLAVVAGSGIGRTQVGDVLTLAIYTPTIEFANSAARLAYVQRLGKAIEAATGQRVDAKSFTSLGQLKKEPVDFAILDAQCYATNPSWKLIANGQVGKAASQRWALFSRVGPSMTALRGKSLAYVKMGCRDEDFIFNAMLESEVDPEFFGGRVGKPNLSGAVAEVASFKGADAVFAPVGSQKGLTKVFDTASVPGPAFVQLNTRLDASLVGKVEQAVVGYGGGGEIDGWAAANDSLYNGLVRSMRRQIKEAVFALPEPVRVEVKDVLQEPSSLRDGALTQVKQHFEVPPPRQ
jgi:hypothetical protein